MDLQGGGGKRQSPQDYLGVTIINRSRCDHFVVEKLNGLQLQK